LAHSPYRK